MTEKTTLLAYLVPKWTRRVEDMATEALAFILNKDEACLRALNDLLRDEGFDEPIKRIRTQVTDKDDSRPDMTGYDRLNGKRLLVEVKFWAALGQKQASGYFDQLDEDSLGVLLFIVPESRCETLRYEIGRLMDKARKKLDHIEPFEGGWRTRIVGSDNRLMLVSWNLLLRRMADAVPDDPSTASDIQQLRGLTRQQGDEAFQPIHTKELGPSLARRICQLNELIDDVIVRGRDELEITTKHKQRRRAGPGQYFTFEHISQGEFLLCVDYYRWAADRDTPLWLRIGGAIEVDHDKLQDKLASWPDSRYNWIYDIPIYLKTGVGRQDVLDDVVSQIGKIKDAVNPSADPPTRPE